MGDDYSNLQVYISTGNDTIARNQVIGVAVEILQQVGYIEVDQADKHDRVIVVCPPSRTLWLTLYDSAAYWTEDDLIHSVEEAENFGRLLSDRIGPIIQLEVSDSALVQLKLFAQGKLIDQYADSLSFSSWKDDAEKQAWRGKEEVWASLFNLDLSAQEKLRSTWDLRDDNWSMARMDILSQTAELIGWNWRFASTGYTWGMDGIPISYIHSLSIEDQNAHTELYFQRIS
jgi:hypothetical protein